MLVFLSYSREDQDRVGQVRADLEELGHTVWLDRRLSGGAEWWTAILAQIRACDVFVLCVTASSLQSEACVVELRYARAVQRLVVPVQLAGGLDPGVAPSPLPHLQWTPYLGGVRAELFGLVRALGGERRDLPDPLPPEPAPPGSYLFTLSEMVRSPDHLDLGGQLLVLHRIEAGIAQVRRRAALAALLAGLRGRPAQRAQVLPAQRPRVLRCVPQHRNRHGNHRSRPPGHPRRGRARPTSRSIEGILRRPGCTSATAGRTRGTSPDACTTDWSPTSVQVCSWTSSASAPALMPRT